MQQIESRRNISSAMSSFLLPWWFKKMNKDAEHTLIYDINYIMMACSILFLFFPQLPQAQKVNNFQSIFCKRNRQLFMFPQRHEYGTMGISEVCYSVTAVMNCRAWHCLNQSKALCAAKAPTELQFRHNVRPIWTKWRSSRLLCCNRGSILLPLGK